MTGPDRSPINTLQMSYFLEVASCQSFTIAAQHLYTTQSTLSKAISSLERTLNVQLFLRSHKRVTLTEAGRHLYERWGMILQDIERSTDECRVLQGGYADTLSVGVLDSHTQEKVSLPYLQAFKKDHPEFKFLINAYPVQEIRSRLIHGALDIAFTVLYDLEQLEGEDFSGFVLQRFPHNVCMLSSNPLCDKEYLEVSDLKEMDFIGVSPIFTPSYCGMIRDLCKQAGFTPNFVRYTSNAISLPYNLQDDHDIFICDRCFSGYHNPSNGILQFRPLIHTESGVSMIWKKDNENPTLKLFLASVSDEKR
ncbi:MAG: LysR family transcriptional regulator [Lachnospiraceae bacterium]|nr:LysR family transcriptional regulator [Lachnospiraceae bacterium]